mmetsp:Transcript_77236/g.213606  ORF Transcript_77236/g.213606 Transcript_77236/m.213606 type:complete len:284 (+) Transcript_77236:1156-2007(+)
MSLAVLELLRRNLLRARQTLEWQYVLGRMRWPLPVSKTTVKGVGGLPMWIVPTCALLWWTTPPTTSIGICRRAKLTAIAPDPGPAEDAAVALAACASSDNSTNSNTVSACFMPMVWMEGRSTTVPIVSSTAIPPSHRNKYQKFGKPLEDLVASAPDACGGGPSSSVGCVGSRPGFGACTPGGAAGSQARRARAAAGQAPVAVDLCGTPAEKSLWTEKNSTKPTATGMTSSSSCAIAVQGWFNETVLMEGAACSVDGSLPFGSRLNGRAAGGREPQPNGGLSQA